MAAEVETRGPQLARLLSLLLLVGAALRLLTSIAAGFLEWHHSAGALPPGRGQAYDVLSTFGAAGDGTGVLLLVAAVATAWWAARLGDPRAETLWPLIGWAFGLTAVLAAMQGVAFGLFYSLPFGQDQTARLVQTEGYALAYVLISVGGVVVATRLRQVADERLLADDDLDAFVFAVDRATGDVRAFFSGAEATRRMHVYSVEDNEFAFYTDEGVLLEAAVVDGRISLQPTDLAHPDELIAALKEFALRRGIGIDPADADEPTAYVTPISNWHWLDMWPPWTRGFGLLLRPLRRIG